MGRRKIEIKAIKDDRNRSVTFLKRKGGLFKKAHELSVLCSVDVAVIIFGQNKKLYEFSSGNIHQTLERYSYYGGPHEHKGPQDFQGKGANDDDDDDDDANISPPQEDASPPHHGIPQHSMQQHQHGMQVMSHGTPQNSPPMPSGMFGQNLAPSQPGSRPSSRTSHIRRQSSNLNPGAPAAIQTQPLGGQMNFYPAQPSPQFFPQQQMAMHQDSPPMGTPPLGTPPMQHQHHQQHQFQQPQAPHQQFQQLYLQDQERRQSMPSNFQQQQQHQQQQQQHQQQQHSLAQNMHMQTPPQPAQQFRSPPMPEPRHITGDKRSHSVFTPIDDERSVLARFWNEPSNQQEASFAKQEPGPRSYSVDAGSQMRGPPAHGPSGSTQRSSESGRTSFDFGPPSRVNSMASDAKRPRLKVSIPTEQSESGDDSSARDRNDNTPNKSVTVASSQSSGLVLPAPSPRSAGGDRVLSAGATGPPNPFARPQPPSQAASNAYRDGIDTPMSALPSRVMTEGGFNMGSPSAFFPEGGSWFGQYGGNSLASPATYQPTPINTNAPSFSEPRRRNDDEEESGSQQRRR